MDELFEKEKKWLLEEKYQEKESPAFFSDLEKLKNGEPLAYLIGNIDFINTKIDLEFKPLIPRPETEFWIYEYIFPKIKNNPLRKGCLKKVTTTNNPSGEGCVKILDIFSGSGCIGLSFLNNFQNTEVDFGEIKKENILQIKKNIKINNLEDKKSQLFQSDIFSKIPEKKYHLILANPPYISDKRKNTVQKTVLENEDSLALFAKDNGLYFIKKLILESPKYLEKNGELWIEFDPWQKELIKDFLQKNKIQNFKVNSEQCTGREGTLGYEFKEDQYQKYRFLKIVK